MAGQAYVPNNETMRFIIKRIKQQCPLTLAVIGKHPVKNIIQVYRGKALPGATRPHISCIAVHNASTRKPRKTIFNETLTNIFFSKVGNSWASKIALPTPAFPADTFTTPEECLKELIDAFEYDGPSSVSDPIAGYSVENSGLETEDLVEGEKVDYQGLQISVTIYGRSE